MSLSHKNILIGICGSIAAFKCCEVISQLVKEGAQVKVIATESALQFVGKASLEGLSGHPVLTSDFTDGHMMSHIQLAKWADLFLIAPATAQTINSLSSGTGHSILVSTYLAYDLKKPLVLAPAMNTQMLYHPSVQASYRTLSNWGVRILPTGEGTLACGDVGEGRLLEPSLIVDSIKQILFPQKKLSILITAGGTKIPIDSVRSITNSSSGRTGIFLADYLTQKNYRVDLVLSKDADAPTYTPMVTRFETYTDLAKILESKLTKNKYDLVIHAAAVSDFTVENIDSTKKLPSGDSMILQLYPTEKIISKIKKWNQSCKLIGFKLTDTSNEEARYQSIRKLFSQSADWVIHNDLSEMSEQKHIFHLHDVKKEIAQCEHKNSLGPLIENIILKELV